MDTVTDAPRKGMAFRACDCDKVANEEHESAGAMVIWSIQLRGAGGARQSAAPLGWSAAAPAARNPTVLRNRHPRSTAPHQLASWRINHGHCSSSTAPMRQQRGFLRRGEAQYNQYCT